MSESPALDIYKYSQKGHVVDRQPRLPPATTVHTLSGIHGGHRNVDHDMPVEQRKDRYGRSMKVK